MEPTESLVLIAELGVALVAAAGIVTAIGGRNRDYDPSDRLRIRSLIAAAALPLAAALLGLSLLSAQIQPARTWSLVSFGYAALIVALVGTTARDLSRLPQRTENIQRTLRLRSAVQFVLGIGAGLLLLYNGLVLCAFWPIVVACSYSLLSAVWLVLNLVLDDH